MSVDLFAVADRSNPQPPPVPEPPAAPRGTDLTVPWIVVGAVMLVAGLVAATMAAVRRVATAGEAMTAALSFAVARSVDGFTLPLPDVASVYQYTIMQVTVGGLGGDSVLTSVRTASVGVGVVGGLLLWAVARRLGLGRAASAVAVGLHLLTVVLVGLYGAVDAGVLAAGWFTVAAAVPYRSRLSRAAVAVAGGIAVVTAPLAAAGLLVLVAALVGSRVIGTALRREVRWAVTAGAALAGLVVAVLATGERALAVTGDAPVARWGLTAVVCAGVVVLGWSCWRQPWLRPVAAATAVLLGCAVVPSPAEGTALLLAVPLLAVLVAAAVDDAVPVRLGWAAVAGATALAAGAAAAGYATLPATAAGSDTAALVTWLNEDLDPGILVAADGLTWAELIRAGVAPDRLLMNADTPTLSVLTDRPTQRTVVAEPGSRAVLAEVASGPGGGRTVVGRAITDERADAVDTRTDRADRVRVGGQLATNPALDLAPEARQHLAAGEVDARLIATLASFTAAHQLTIADFPASPVEPVDAPRRTVVITAVDGHQLTDPAPAELAQRWYGAQQAPYRPALVDLADGRLTIRYLAPAPLRLLSN